MSEAIKRFFLADNNQFAWPTANWPEFIAFMVTIVPFLHGMNRHLDRTLAEVRRSGKRWLLAFLLIDFGFFIVESCFFVSMAATVSRGAFFFKILVALLLVDAGWAFLTAPVTKGVSWKWMAINLAVSGFMAILIYRVRAIPDGWKSIILAGMAILRTLLDYCLVWNFYFPPDDPAPATDDNTSERPEGAIAPAG